MLQKARTYLPLEPEGPDDLSTVITVAGADLSLRSPGFAKLAYSKHKGQFFKPVVSSFAKYKTNKNVAREQILLEIYEYMQEWVRSMPDGTVFVRERAFSRFAPETQVLLRVVGIADLVLWQERGLRWEEIAPKSVKFTVTNDGNASKAFLQETLMELFPTVKFQNNDESDALAVVLAHMLTNNWVPVAIRKEKKKPGRKKKNTEE